MLCPRLALGNSMNEIRQGDNGRREAENNMSRNKWAQNEIKKAYMHP